jgi:hypothetical protein
MGAVVSKRLQAAREKFMDQELISCLHAVRTELR